MPPRKAGRSGWRAERATPVLKERGKRLGPNNAVQPRLRRPRGGGARSAAAPSCSRPRQTRSRRCARRRPQRRRRARIQVPPHTTKLAKHTPTTREATFALGLPARQEPCVAIVVVVVVVGLLDREVTLRLGERLVLLAAQHLLRAPRARANGRKDHLTTPSGGGRCVSAATSPPAVCPRASPLVVPSRARRPPSNVCRRGRVLDARARYRRRSRVSSTDLGSTHAHARALLPTADPRAGLSRAEANARSRALRHSPGKGTRGTRGAGRAGALRRGARRLPLTDLVLLLLVDLLLEHARGAAHRAAPV